MPAKTRRLCPKCKSADFTLKEIGTVSVFYEYRNGVEVFSYQAGRTHAPGVWGRCDRCGHKWKLRKAHSVMCVTVEID